MEYQIAIDPELAIDAETIAQAWNSDPEAQALATARTAPPAGVAFPIDPELTQQAMLFLTGAGIATATTLAAVPLDVVKDLLKEKLKAFLSTKMERPPEMEISWHKTGDGYLLVVEGEEDGS